MLVFLLDLVLLRELVLEFAEVDDLADGRGRPGDDFHKIRIALPGESNGVAGSHHPELSPPVVDHAYFGNADLVVDAGAFLLADGPASYVVSVLSLFSFVTLARNSASGMAPRSPTRCLRTATAPADCSLSPTTSMYGTFLVSHSRIL